MILTAARWKLAPICGTRVPKQPNIQWDLKHYKVKGFPSWDKCTEWPKITLNYKVPHMFTSNLQCNLDSWSWSEAEWNWVKKFHSASLYDQLIKLQAIFRQVYQITQNDVDHSKVKGASYMCYCCPGVKKNSFCVALRLAVFELQAILKQVYHLNSARWNVPVSFQRTVERAAFWNFHSHIVACFGPYVFNEKKTKQKNY